MTHARPTRRRSDPFGGFDTDAATVTLPATFLTQIVPAITSIEELQVSLAIFRVLSELGGLETPVAEATLARDRHLRHALREDGNPSEADRRIALGLDLALARGTVLRFVASSKRSEAMWYYVNTAVNRATLQAMARGAIQAPKEVWVGQQAPEIALDMPNAFRLYEQNIGPLTPLLADQIGRAIEEYPLDWIEDAIGEAVAYNRRSWRYIARILENWSVQGRADTDQQG